MKTLTGLDEQLKYFEDIEEKDQANMPTYRKLFKAAIGVSLAKSGEEAIDMFQLGLKLKVVPDVQLEDAEFKLLKEVCSNNPQKLVAIFHGQIMAKLQEAQK